MQMKANRIKELKKYRQGFVDQIKEIMANVQVRGLPTMPAGLGSGAGKDECNASLCRPAGMTWRGERVVTWQEGWGWARR